MNEDDLHSSVVIKDNPELRHALAHMYYAIEALTKGNKMEALYELKSIEGLIFFNDEDEQGIYIEGKNNEKL